MEASTAELRVLSWNLFHGRDAPPDPALFTLRSRLFRKPEDNGVHLQLNRTLREEFATVIAQAGWSLCLLQETPPSWSGALARQSGALPCQTLTSRNELHALTSWLARWNPDLIASWEGGSNLTLVRSPWRIVAGSYRSLLLNPLRQRLLIERRRMGFVRIRLEQSRIEVCVANIHASTKPHGQTESELLLAARAAVAWAAGAPLLVGGDFNLRPVTAPALFERLARELGLARTTAPDAIDHLLVRGLEIVQAPARWPAERRECEIRTELGPRRLRLSDHAPVEARFAVRPPRCDTTSVDG